MIPVARKQELVVQKSSKELLVYDLRTNRALCLNQLSSKIWRYCDGESSPFEIRKRLEKDLNAKISEDLVWFALEQLYNEDLLVNEDDFTVRYKGLSRRDVIKKIGLSSAISLPIIASLTAPAAVNAQSIATCNSGTACTCTSTGMSVGAGNQCAPAGTGGCTANPTCLCRANNSGNNFNGTCSV